MPDYYDFFGKQKTMSPSGNVEGLSLQQSGGRGRWVFLILLEGSRPVWRAVEGQRHIPCVFLGNSGCLGLRFAQARPLFSGHWAGRESSPALGL